MDSSTLVTPATPALVAATRLGHGLDDRQLAVLAGVLQCVQHAAGEVLAAQGSSDDRLWLVLEGRLAVVHNPGQRDEQTMATLEPGDFAHETGFVDGLPRFAALLAASPARVLVTRREALEGLLGSHPRVVYAVLCAILRAVHGVQTKLSVQASELTNYVVKQHGRY